MNLTWLALGWIAYAALHSLLAALTVKAWVTRRWPGFARYYRLAFNALAVVLILPLAWATYAIPGEWLWRWSGPVPQIPAVCPLPVRRMCTSGMRAAPMPGARWPS